jgi:hypothetical protein
MSAAVLAATETMSDAERWRFMLSLGRLAPTDAAASAVLATLSASADFYSQRLAIMASYASGNREVILSALTGASAALAGLARKAAVRFLDAETLAAVLPDLPASRRQRLARACADAGLNVVERAFPRLSADDRARLVAYAGADFAAAQLAQEEFVDRLAPQDWSRIARRHPGPAIGAMTRRLAEEAEPSRSLLAALNGVIAGAARASPRKALPLLQAASLRTPLGNLSYRRIAPHCPAEVAALLLADGKEQRAILRKVDDATRKALLRQRGRGATAVELRRLSPATRLDLYADGILEPVRNAAGALPRDMVALLPAAERHQEARRAWAAPQHRAHPELRLPYLAFLPYPEALSEAGPSIGDPDGEVRAIACAALIGTGRYEPPRIAEILAFVRARRNEQDPVRLAMMAALAGLPPTRWGDAHLADVSDILDAAVSARDISSRTLDAAARLLLRMAPERIGFVGQELTRIAEKLGRVPLVDLEARLSDGQMADLVPEILPLLEVWRDRSHSFAVTSFLASFGRRLRASAPLIELLVGMTDDPRAPVASQALGTLMNARAHGRLKSLIPDLLRRDPSWVLSPGIAPWINRRRQDLLTAFLTPRAYGGRFQSHQTAILPSFDGFYHRWTEQQQKTYAASLIAVAGSGKRSFRELRRALAKIAAMPAADAAPIEGMARLDAEDKALRDMAVIALGRLDGARGVRGLVEALDDDRGRIAIYALRRAILDMPAAAAIAFLRRAPLKKVTVAKEIVRLAGDVGGEAGWRFLAGFVEQPDLHKDVRIAVLRALWSYLEREDVWDVFARAAGEDAAAARATAHIPQERLSRSARGRLARHLGSLLRHESAVVRLEAVKRLAASPVPAAGTALAGDLAALLEPATEEVARHAATALALCVPLAETADLASLFAARGTTRTLQAIVAALVAQNPAHPKRVEPVSRQLVALLLDAGRQVMLALRLAVLVMPPEALAAVIERMAARGLLHPGALIEALSAARQRRGNDLGSIEPRLAAADDPTVRRIGLAALVVQAEKLGWSGQARVRLDAYRRDPAPVVAEAAELVFPPDDAEPHRGSGAAGENNPGRQRP